MGYGNNSKAALITRGLAEIARLGVAAGANPLTFAGLTGVGDLIVTCTSMHSRNHRAGIQIGQGIPLDVVLERMGMVVEGVRATQAAYKKGYYYTVLNRKDQNGKRKPLWISTGLPAIEENEAEAESMCLSARIQYSLDLKNGVAEKTLAHEEPDEDNSVQNDSDANQSANPLFADLLKEWLAFRHPDNIVVGEDFNFDRRIKLNTWAGYAENIERNLYPTFKAHSCTVREITPDLLKGHYAYRLKSGKKKSTVVKDYTIINQALNYAVSKKIISVNPNSAITLHKIEKYNAATLNAEQMLYYLEFIVGDVIEIPILLGGFYGMRRSECVGTRECQFDFKYKFFRANHTVTTAKINKKKDIHSIRQAQNQFK